MLANDQASQQNLEVAHSQMLWLDGLMAEQGSDFIAGDSELHASFSGRRLNVGLGKCRAALLLGFILTKDARAWV
jgi:hypothetical protein